VLPLTDFKNSALHGIAVLARKATSIQKFMPTRPMERRPVTLASGERPIHPDIL